MNESSYPVKQVIVVNASLRDIKGQKLPKGKWCAQVAHASMKVFLDRMKFEAYPNSVNSASDCDDSQQLYKTWFTSAMRQWMQTDFAKVVVKVESEEELRRVYDTAVSMSVPCAIIEDNGTTCFGNEKTVTCIAVGPATSREIDKITGDLQLFQ